MNQQKNEVISQDISKIVENNQRKIEPIVGKYLKNKKVLDVGCGNGLNSCYFKQLYSCDITLTDKEDIRTAEALIFPFVKSSLEKLPFEDKQFDVVFLQYTIHHISPEISVESVFKELSRISNIIIVIEETKTEKTNLELAKKFDAEMNEKIHPDVDMPIYRYYDDTELKNYFKNANLEIIEERILNETKEEHGCLQNKAYVLSTNPI